MLENLDKIMHLRFNFDACPMHSPSGFVHLTQQNLSTRALFCLNSLAKVNTQLLIYKYAHTIIVPYLRYSLLPTQFNKYMIVYLPSCFFCINTKYKWYQVHECKTGEVSKMYTHYLSSQSTCLKQKQWKGFFFVLFCFCFLFFCFLLLLISVDNKT